MSLAKLYVKEILPYLMMPAACLDPYSVFCYDID